MQKTKTLNHAKSQGKVYQGDKCQVCDKPLWKRDVEYSRYVFGAIYCASHIPFKDLWHKDTSCLKK